MHYVYVLTRNRKYYIGRTENLRRRFKQHQAIDINCKLLYYEAYATKKLAIVREANLKHYGSAWSGLKRRLQ